MNQIGPLKKRDAWWTVLVVDPIAIPISRALKDVRWISPNAITIVGLLTGVLSGWFFLAGSMLTGAILFELRFLLDCIDGKLARLRNAGSKVGAFVDLAGDKTVIAWNYGALSWYLQSNAHLPAFFPTVLVGIYLLRSWLVLYRIHVNAGQPTEWEKRFGLEQSGPIGSYRRWMANRRLIGRPNSIDVENITCFLIPLIFAPTVVAYGLVIAAAYYAIVIALYWTRLVSFLDSGDFPRML